MKLLIVGGCGQQAQPAIKILLDSPEFDQVILGDINLEMASQLVEKHKNPKLSAIKLDAFDHQGMVKAMQGVDIIYNCSGPYHLLGLKVLTAAIEAGKHYVDYCDDVVPTLEMLELTEQAKAKGITAIVGLGASPGVTNLLAMRGASKLDSVDEVNMYWAIGEGEPEGPAVLDHMFDILCGDVIQFIGGKEVRVPALSGAEEEIEMPAPFGKLPTVFVGHPEPATLQRFIPGVKQVISKFAGTPDEVGFFQGMRDLGLFSKEPVSVKGTMVAPRDLLITQWLTILPEDVPAEECESAVITDVKGHKDGAPAGIRFTLIANMAPMTSIPGALGVRMLARGEIAKTGVIPPEACVSPDAVLDTLVEQGLIKLQEQVL